MSDPDERLDKPLVRHGLKESLVRWVLQQRRRAGDARGPAAHDEATHSPPKAALVAGPRAWAEEYVFAAVQRGLGLVVRLEWMPGRDAHRVWVVLVREHDAFSLPGGQALSHHRGDGIHGTRAGATGERDRWRACGLEIDCLAPHERWSVRYVGRIARAGASAGARPLEDGGEGLRCSIDLVFTADRVPFVPGTDDDPELIARHLAAATWDRDLVRSIRQTRMRGYVQLGVLHGTIALGDELVPLRASAIREHTWGERDWGASLRALQCYVALDPAGDGARAWIHHTRFPELVLEGGFVDERGRTCSVSSIGITETARPDRAPSHVGIDLGCDAGASARGAVLSIEGEMLGETTFAVDGRGFMEIGLLRVPPAGLGIWAAQRSLTLPARMRPPAR